jgi:acylphosphatase
MPELSGTPAVRRRVHVVVRGDVQGVGFRWYTREQAMAGSVAGWVRNLPGGEVEAVFEGDHDAVEDLVRWCRSGPRSASVSGVEVRDEEPRGEEGFRIAH